jgi:serine/threonine protein kinase/tetratricopeptide (TPR) repeat protein
VIAPASRKLGKYEIRHKLGRGGMADVYLALDTELGHDVALKLIEDSPDPDTRDSIEAERRGAELQRKLAAVDLHVAGIFSFGDIENFFFVAMEYVEGRDLHELMREGPMPPEAAVDVAIAVAGTLEAAHNLEVEIGGKSFHGIVHGDIKPKNIRIDTRNEVRVLDFGIAKALSLSRKLTRNEFGSVPYSSPERLLAGEVDVHSDLWALAVMLYEMVTGLQPYHADTTERLERMIRSRVPPPPAPDPCPDSLRRILVKAMMPDPEARYQTAREFADDLIMFRAGGPVRAVAEDLDATRRTSRRPDSIDLGATRRSGGESADDSGETRRTAAEYRRPDEVLNWPVAPPAPRNPLTRYLARATAMLVLAGCLYGLYASVSSYLLYRRGQQLERAIQTESLTDPNEIWSQWTELSKDNSSSLMLRGPRKAVKQKLVEAADRVIASYRNSDAVYENGWKAARDDLTRALTLDPDDSVRGKLRLAEGHLSRIAGMAPHNVALLNDAVEKFNEAQRLLPNSPDPALGLARVYVYGLHDIDRAYQALQQAEKHGHPLGSREKAQLADGYRDRANRLFWDSRNVRDLPQEKDQIVRAKDDYQRALELYQSIAPYGNSTSAIQDVESSLESIDFRLHEIDHKGIGDAAVGALKKLLHIWR